ncbi:hypothetical protein AO384_0849 [Moraxella catarrhalis]|uniref:Uncharacterized protein n=1 Tax=Moraxella catarrhalis TaxID=480 RepID=A0A198UJN8_MORCA|nr:hypothetical protein AO384_0849 [Moraxella catarrhalis]
MLHDRIGRLEIKTSQSNYLDILHDRIGRLERAGRVRES